jgi:hypothetical protein
MKANISIQAIDDIEEVAQEVMHIYENPPGGAKRSEDYEDDNEGNTNDLFDYPYAGEDGLLEVFSSDNYKEIDQLEIEADFSIDEFPDEFGFNMSYIGWDETESRMAALHGLDYHGPARVILTLKNKWIDPSGKSIALYDVAVEHE